MIFSRSLNCLLGGCDSGELIMLNPNGFKQNQLVNDKMVNSPKLINIEFIPITALTESLNGKWIAIGD